MSESLPPVGRSVAVGRSCRGTPVTLTDGPLGLRLDNGSTIEGRPSRDQSSRTSADRSRSMTTSAHISMLALRRLRKTRSNHRATSLLPCCGRTCHARASGASDRIGPCHRKATASRLHRCSTHRWAVRGRLRSIVQSGTQPTRAGHGVGRPRLDLKWFGASSPARTAAEQRAHRRSHRLLPHPPRRRRGEPRASSAKLKAYRASVLKAAVEGRLVPTEAELARDRGPRLRAGGGAAGAHPQGTPPPLGGSRAGQDQGRRQDAEGRQVEGEVPGAGAARTRADCPSCPRGGAGRRWISLLDVSRLAKRLSGTRRKQRSDGAPICRVDNIQRWLSGSGSVRTIEDNCSRCSRRAPSAGRRHPVQSSDRANARQKAVGVHGEFRRPASTRHRVSSPAPSGAFRAALRRLRANGSSRRRCDQVDRDKDAPTLLSQRTIFSAAIPVATHDRAGANRERDRPTAVRR